jgi:periplasmic divalent cation tolerance protein
VSERKTPAKARDRGRAALVRDLRVVLSTAPPRRARSLARRLVDEGGAACVNVVPGVESTYRWRGRVETARESLLVVKTTAASLPRCLATLAGSHPYEVPEGLVLSPGAALAAYARWMRTESR